MSVVASIRSNAAGILSLNNRPALPVPVTSNIMLKHEDNPQPQAPSQSAAQVRVTPEELAAAVTALQIRKEGSPGTIAIGDAVDELGLDVTPEEVLAEVEACRIKQRYSEKRPSKQRLKALLAGLTVLVGISAWGISQQFVSHPDVETQTLTTTSFIPPATPAPVRVTAPPTLVVVDPSGKRMMLSEVSDNQPVTCAQYGGHFQQESSIEPFTWTLIKYNGNIYLRGWIAKSSPDVLKNDGADVSALQTSGSLPVTLPINGFRFAETPQNVPGREFHATEIRLDGHAYEKW